MTLLSVTNEIGDDCVFLVRRIEVKNSSKELNIYLREFITCWFPIHSDNLVKNTK